MQKKFDRVNMFLIFSFGVSVGVMISTIGLTTVPRDRYELIKSMGFGFKDAWNMPTDSFYRINLVDGKYKKQFKFEKIGDN